MCKPSAIVINRYSRGVGFLLGIVLGAKAFGGIVRDYQNSASLFDQYFQGFLEARFGLSNGFVGTVFSEEMTIDGFGGW